MRAFLITFYCLLILTAATAQPCSNPGQTPGTAFPVCGTSVFDQNTVPLCDGRVLPSPHCTGVELKDVNPYWYKFTCFQSGSLGLLITPRNLSDDYDWELYDVTNANPDDVYSNGALAIASNWSGEVGLTGASAAGTTLWSCAGNGQPLFTSRPALIAGHSYLLMVSHFTSSQSGYSLEFKGGTAVITDPNIPHLQKATPNCGGNVITIKLNKKIKCSSLAANGSDFVISPATALPVAAVGINCGSNFDTDSIQLQLNGFLTAGTYSVQVKQGTDANTLLDYCNNAVPLTDVASFSVQPSAPVPLDSLTALSCAPSTLQLVFSRPVVCSSIAADGSDFAVNGTYPVNISSVTGSCAGGITNSITITLSQPLQQAGTFTIRLLTGSDGNTILNDCGIETPAGASIVFQVKDTVNADFTYNIQYGCNTDVINFSHAGGNGVNKWSWILDDGFTSGDQNPQAAYAVFDTKNIQLIATNGFCSDTARTSIVLDNFLKADFSVLEDNCPLEPVVFTTNSLGRIVSHEWDFGDGGFGSGSAITHLFTRPTRETIYTVRYTVADSFGCRKTIQKPVKVFSSCTIAVPNAFTPNGDRINPLLYPLNAVKADQLEFTVYNRWGQMVFRTTTWKRGWDGTLNGRPQPSGTYVWTLRYVNRDTGKRVEQKGYTVLIR
ncbi:MAG: gliding motility-associated C-terminal domain-containing protein [Chitinophagaceae bacterium]